MYVGTYPCGYIHTYKHTLHAYVSDIAAHALDYIAREKEGGKKERGGGSKQPKHKGGGRECMTTALHSAVVVWCIPRFLFWLFSVPSVCSVGSGVGTGRDVHCYVGWDVHRLGGGCSAARRRFLHRGTDVRWVCLRRKRGQAARRARTSCGDRWFSGRSVHIYNIYMYIIEIRTYNTHT